MKTQFDSQVRMVNLVNLVAMCGHQSGFSHRYTVSKISRSRVHVEYSNPDEYGNESPMTAVFPCFPNDFGPENADNPYIVLQIMRVVGDTWNGEGWQAFDQLLTCPVLYRSCDDTVPPRWETEAGIKVRIADTMPSFNALTGDIADNA
jgi:hypothetical protein